MKKPNALIFVRLLYLVAAAFNDAVRRVQETSKEKMGDVTGGMPLPPGFKMPF